MRDLKKQVVASEQLAFQGTQTKTAPCKTENLPELELEKKAKNNLPTLPGATAYRK